MPAAEQREPGITVVGAGIVGVCCALYLLRDGHRVTLVDRGDPGMGCSFGNAGHIQAGACIPIATPGVLRRVPSMLADPESPLVIRWQHLPTLLPYLWRFILSARPGRVEAIAKVLGSVLSHAVADYAPLVALAQAQALVRENRELMVYRSAAAFEAARPQHDFRRRHGVAVEELDAGQLREIEPALAPVFERAAMLPTYLRTVDPLRFTQALLAAFQQAGGRFEQADVLDVRHDPAGGATLATSRGEMRAPTLVLATGAHSRRLAARLGSPLPLNTERGYHLMLPNPGVALRRPVSLAERRVGLIPMPGGVRIVGSAELASIDAPPRYERAWRLYKIARQALPSLDASDAKPWMGRRPSTPDSLPVIGAAPGAPGVFFAFGHGHLGLTMGAVTGRLIADLVAGRAPPIDMAPLGAGRFGRPS